MSKKFLITLLSSSNSKLLKLCYNTIINQYKHNLNYTIVIIVNTLNTEYYKEVCDEFKDINVEIIETDSNGKPGMGHNSLFEVFKIKTMYDYLISIDGDDFLYPYALHQLSKCFLIENDVDVVCIYGNDTIRDYTSPYDNSDIYLSNHFYLRMGYNLPKKFSESELLINPIRTDFSHNGVQTIIRFIMCSRNFINQNKDEKLYCEECYILDDYKFYLNYISNVFTKNIKGMIINSDHIYLYNNINHNSISRINNSKFDIDYKIIKNYIYDFIYLEKFIGMEWNLDKLQYHNLSTVFNEDLGLVSNNDGSYNINKDNLLTKSNYKYIIEFANKLALDYYTICMTNIEYYLFKGEKTSEKIEKNRKIAFDLCLFLINNKICDRKLFIYTAISYYYLCDDINTIKYIEKSDYMINKYSILVDFYNNYKTNKNK